MISRKGAYVLVDGQFGSTGKGLLASYLAARFMDRVDVVVSNAGPNSGHTFYHGEDKHVLKQLPTFAVMAKLMGKTLPVYLSAGAVIDPDILNAEVEKYRIPVFLAETATVVTAEDKRLECFSTIGAVAGTRQGVGSALARKVHRDPHAVVRSIPIIRWHPNITPISYFPVWNQHTAFVEVSQGFSLGIHSGFYPKVTSRECTVMQAMADARIAPLHFRHSFMVIRTYPIRVGDVDGHSAGGWYADQAETSWDAIGVEPETTTVTGRIRRVANFSFIQFQQAVRANTPSLILVNFMNYMKEESDRRKLADRLVDIALQETGLRPKFLFGFGPKITDIRDTP